MAGLVGQAKCSSRTATSESPSQRLWVIKAVCSGVWSWFKKGEKALRRVWTEGHAPERGAMTHPASTAQQGSRKVALCLHGGHEG